MINKQTEQTTTKVQTSSPEMSVSEIISLVSSTAKKSSKKRGTDFENAREKFTLSTDGDRPLEYEFRVVAKTHDYLQNGAGIALDRPQEILFYTVQDSVWSGGSFGGLHNKNVKTMAVSPAFFVKVFNLLPEKQPTNTLMLAELVSSLKECQFDLYAYMLPQLITKQTEYVYLRDLLMKLFSLCSQEEAQRITDNYINNLRESKSKLDSYVKQEMMKHAIKTVTIGA